MQTVFKIKQTFKQFHKIGGLVISNQIVLLIQEEQQITMLWFTFFFFFLLFFQQLMLSVFIAQSVNEAGILN